MCACLCKCQSIVIHSICVGECVGGCLGRMLSKEGRGVRGAISKGLAKQPQLNW